MESEQKIINDLKSGFYNTNPHAAANALAYLAGEFGFIMGQLETILSRKPAVWNSLRPNFKSDSACEKAWEQTTDGLNEQGLKLRAKACEKMSSALRTIIRLAEIDYRNQSHV